MKKSGTWPAGVRMPTSMDLILGKQLGTILGLDHFQLLPNILKLSTGLNLKKVWGVIQNAYHFPDLMTWLELWLLRRGKRKRRRGRRRRKKKNHTKPVQARVESSE